MKSEPQIYELIRVIEHIGSHKEGHYISFTRGEAACNRCDDTNISPVALHDVLKCQEYMLMYRAKTTESAGQQTVPREMRTMLKSVPSNMPGRTHRDLRKGHPTGKRAQGSQVRLPWWCGEVARAKVPQAPDMERPVERSKLQSVGRHPIPQGG